jgi:outer membrane protein
MKKLISTIVLAALSPAVFAIDATPFFSVYAGGGAWQTDFTGTIGEPDFTVDMEELGFSDETNGTFYVAFEHSVPVIPQVRLERTGISSTGLGTLTSEYRLGDGRFVVGEEVASEFDITLTDAVLYWEIAMVDFGITVRQVDVTVSAESGGGSDTESFDGFLPMLYLQAKVDLPFTGLYFMGNANAISYDDKSITDFRAAIGYGIEISILAEIGLEVGYRSFEVDLGEEDDISGDIELSGPYAGVNIKF